MSIDDSKPVSSDASFPKQPPITGNFNRDNALAAEIASLPPAARDQCRMLQELGAERLETEKKSQQRSHAYRVMKAKNELLEAYISNPAPRPPGIKADPTQDLKIIADEAERLVRDKEEHYLKTIARESDANLRQVITKAKQEQSAGQDTRRDAGRTTGRSGHNRGYDHDPEHEG